MCLIQDFNFVWHWPKNVMSTPHLCGCGWWLETLLMFTKRFCELMKWPPNKEKKHSQHRCLQLIFWRESWLRDGGCGSVRASSVLFLQPSDAPLLWQRMLPSHDTDAVPLSRSRRNWYHVNAPRQHSKYTFCKDNNYWWHQISAAQRRVTLKLWSVIAWKSLVSGLPG